MDNVEQRRIALQDKLRRRLKVGQVYETRNEDQKDIPASVPIINPLPPEQRPDHDLRGRPLGGRRRNGVF